MFFCINSGKKVNEHVFWKLFLYWPFQMSEENQLCSTLTGKWSKFIKLIKLHSPDLFGIDLRPAAQGAHELVFTQALFTDRACRLMFRSAARSVTWDWNCCISSLDWDIFQYKDDDLRVYSWNTILTYRYQHKTFPFLYLRNDNCFWVTTNYSLYN